MVKKIKVVLSNRAMCKFCSDIVESSDSFSKNFCRCGKIYVSGGTQNVLQHPEDSLINLSETYDMEVDL